MLRAPGGRQEEACQEERAPGQVLRAALDFTWKAGQLGVTWTEGAWKGASMRETQERAAEWRERHGEEGAGAFWSHPCREVAGGPADGSRVGRAHGRCGLSWVRRGGQWSDAHCPQGTVRLERVACRT